MNLVFGENVFDEQEIQRMFAKFTNKWVVHLKAVGLVKHKDKRNDFLEWYADKTNVNVLNGILNSDPESRELYVLLENLSEVTHAYETWFPSEMDLTEGEEYLYVRFLAISPDSSYVISNEKPEFPVSSQN